MEKRWKYYEINYVLTRIFRERSNVHGHRTRTSGDIEVPRLVSSRTAFSVIYRGAKLWNKLVQSTKELPINQFKTELRAGLLDRYTFEIDWSRYMVSPFCLL